MTAFFNTIIAKAMEIHRSTKPTNWTKSDSDARSPTIPAVCSNALVPPHCLLARSKEVFVEGCERVLPLEEELFFVFRRCGRRRIFLCSQGPEKTHQKSRICACGTLRVIAFGLSDMFNGHVPQQDGDGPANDNDRGRGLAHMKGKDGRGHRPRDCCELRTAKDWSVRPIVCLPPSLSPSQSSESTSMQASAPR